VAGISPIEAVGVGAAIGLAAVAFIALYTLRRMRERRQKLRDGGPNRPEYSDDRAFNRLAMARREADLLAAQGRNVAQARELIDLSQHEFGIRQFDQAYNLAQQAHEALVLERRRPSGSVAAPPAASPGSPRAAPPPSPSATAAGAAPAGGPPPGEIAARLPRNRAESQFQMKLLESELADAKRDRPNDAATQGGTALYAQAQAAFSKEDYTEALRLSLRARRQLGAVIETVSLASLSAKGGALPSSAGDPEDSAERAAAAERCSSCGHPTLPGDAFCRGCGTPRSKGACPQCGASRLPTDVFCARCGASFS
jgi:Double zinc ribbon